MPESKATAEKRSLFRLVGDLPSLLITQVRNELEKLKGEVVSKLKSLGIGAGLLVAALVFLFFALCVLIATAILGIATVLPAWLAALIVGVALLVITGILAAVGVSQLKRGIPPAPTETIESVKKDVRTIQGTEE